MTLLLVVLCIANFAFGLGLFGRFAKQAMTTSFVILYLQLRFYAPSIYRYTACARIKGLGVPDYLRRLRSSIRSDLTRDPCGRQGQPGAAEDLDLNVLVS